LTKGGPHDEQARLAGLPSNPPAGQARDSPSLYTAGHDRFWPLLPVYGDILAGHRGFHSSVATEPPRLGEVHPMPRLLGYRSLYLSGDCYPHHQEVPALTSDPAERGHQHFKNYFVI